MGKLMLNNINYTGGSGGTNVVPNPPETATDDLTSIKIDNTVYNLAGGDVADVEVNGESVLDANHVAQIKSYKTLTQAEYDALPSSKLTDDVLYCITDAGIVEEQQFAPVIYSLEERQIGTWIDGKPLYAKTCHAQNVTSSVSVIDASFLEINYQLVGYETNRIKMGGVYNGAIFVPSSISSSATLRVYVNSDGLQCNIEGLGSGLYADDVYFTILYTKTTDIPGSGDWTTSGIPTVHYSTAEHVVGIDEDDNTIYEKTFKIASLTWSYGSGFSFIAVDVSSIGRVEKLDFIRGTAHEDTDDRMLDIPYFRVENSESVLYECRINSDKTPYLVLFVRHSFAAGYSLSNLSVTLQYVKSSS